jgi:hypothetical protein
MMNTSSSSTPKVPRIQYHRCCRPISGYDAEPRDPPSHLSTRHIRTARTKIPTYENHQYRCVADVELAVENETDALRLTRQWQRIPLTALQQ